MTAMIKLRHQQPSLWHRGLAKDIEGLWEPWMLLVDKLLEDEQLLDAVYEAQGERHPQSRIRGRMQTPAEVLLRLLLLKHIRNWSYDALEREVRANLVYRASTRIGDEKVPDAKTLARLGQLIEPKVIAQLHQRVVELAQERGVTQGRKLRVDTTVVESNIHYPTDSSLLGDGTRVLTRTMKKIESKTGGLKRKVRDRMRSIRKRVLAIALSTRLLGPSGEERRKRQYRELLSLTRKVINQAQRVLAEVKQSPRRRRTPVEGLTQSLETMVGRVRQVVKQTKIRIFAGDTKSPGKIVSVFEPHTEIIRKGKASKPNEFGKLVKIQEAENQIVTYFEVYAERPADSTLLGARCRCTRIDWDESRAWWPPMRDSIRARTKKRGKRWACGGCWYPTRKPQAASGSFFSTSVGFVTVKSGEPARNGALVTDDRPGLERARPRTLREHVLEQIGTELSHQADQLIALHLLDLLDENGYIGGALETVAAVLNCHPARVEEVLARLQQFDPAGIFARDLPECLALQLRERNGLRPGDAGLARPLAAARRAQHPGADPGLPGRCRGHGRDDRRDQIARSSAGAGFQCARSPSRSCPIS